MPALVKIAVRNLVEHKGKSLIVGVIIALGVMILVVGSSLLDSASRSLARSFVDSYSGQVIITAKAHGNVTLFGVAEMGAVEGTPLLPDFDKLTTYLRSRPEVKGFTFQVSAAEQLNKVGEDAAGSGPFIYLFGIEPASYAAMFDNMTLASGAGLVPGQEGILLSKRQVEQFRKELGTDLTVGDKVLIQSFGTAIREVTLRGIIAFKQRNAATDLIAYVDPDTVRALAGISQDTRTGHELDAAEAGLLSASESTLFAENTPMVHASSGRGRLPAQTKKAAAQTPQPASGPWQFILVNLKDPRGAASFAAKTNQWIADQGIGARASDWRTAAGPFAIVPNIMRFVFTLAILIIAIVTVIIIMNTLMVSISERTGEIGTMRALGAQKSFVWRMLLAETLVISLLFGVAGMALGSLLVGVLNHTGITASGPLLQAIAGGATLRPTIAPSALGSSILLVILIAIIAHIYPVRAALRIQPVVAIQARSE
ncbi:MAG TPA: FtsX-like permease family protein [Spirochaetia bacterium]|nr:FtsX-like permease family protein [Spirochaetia bacterium]